MRKTPRSKCPIAFSLDTFGDRWTLLVIRDMVFGRRRYYREFLEAGEGIATNILADRLQRLELAGIVAKTRDVRDGKRFRYTLTEKGFDLIPVLLEMIAWGGIHDAGSGATGDFVNRIRRDREAVIREVRAAHPLPG